MIKFARVDHRLIHGQVAFSWTKFLGVNCILIPSDKVAADGLRQNLLRMAKPSSVKLIMKSMEESVNAVNKGAADKYQMMVLFESIEDAYRFFSSVDQVKELNLGGTKKMEDRKGISKAVYISDEDEKQLRELLDKGVDITVQMVPDEPKVSLESLL